MKHLFKAAQRRGLRVAKVKVKNERGTYDLYFVKDEQGKPLFDGNSFTWDEIRVLFPDLETQANL